ncbi:aldo/keto reductase [Chitinophaga sp. Cy-1792]|uniref:aldo/keto reductase n=1 Tax=Chitinophaga sp. Cy-1792 TaxID=2608339 RepID=UPI0014243B82|nr:aldo/keto reductase [Chitinophaga sp. Cy-1792]NIG54405.1 aldo/keto reductase [Chitinophaga sp. Cy-1792]
MEFVTLNNGVEMPVLGFGVYQVTDLEECERSVSDALSTGYRLIDTASAYGNETAVGKAIKKSGIKREDIFLTTKLWVQDAGEGKTRNAFNKSLKNLGLEYIDLYLIHQPYGDIYGAWRDMEALLKEGLVRAIGVSNFESDRLIDLILHNEVKPAVNQIETHPFNQQIAAHDFMKENDVQQESWGPFAEGKHDIFTNALLAGIGKKYNKSVAQVILRWLIQRSIVVIPKSVKKERIEQNFDVFDFSLSGEDMDQIVSLDLKTSSFFDHRDPDMVKWLGTRKLT